MTNTLCVECRGSLVEQTITHDIRHNSQLYTFRHVPARVCSACGAVFIDAPVLKRIERVLTHHAEPETYQKVPLFSYEHLSV